MRNAELNELQVGIKTDGRNTNSLRYGDDTISSGRKQRGTTEPLDEADGE